MLDCALISSDEGFRHAVIGILRQPDHNSRLAVDLQATADGLTRDAVAKVLKAAPRVVFLDLGADPSGVAGIRVINQEAPDVALIVAGPSLSAEGLLAVMRAGAAEYLPRPISQDEILEAFFRVRRRTKASVGDAPVMLGQVVTIFSAKGGTGVTTVATNLAVALRMLTERKVLVLDLSPLLGTAAVAMGLQPRYTYLDVIRNFHRIDTELFHSFLEAHESGVHLLASPSMPPDAASPSSDDIHDLISLCRQHFDYVVIDGGSTVSSLMPQLLHESEDRIFVVTPELPTLRNLKQALDLYGRTNGKGPPQVVLNQYKDGLGLSARDVEDGLGHRVAAILERDDGRVLQSINLGRPEVLSGRSKLAKAFLDLGVGVAGEENVVMGRKGFLGLFGLSSKKARKKEHKSGKETS